MALAFNSKAFHYARLLAITVILLWATAIIVSRLAIHYIEDQKEVLLQRATELFNTPIAIEKIDIYWNGHSPVFNFEKVDLYNKEQSNVALSLDRVQVEINLFQSLLKRQLQTNHLLISGVDVQLFQQPNGSVEISDLKQPKREVEDQGFDAELAVDWLFANRSVVLQDVALSWHDNNDFTLRIENFSLLLRNRGNRHNIAGNFYIKGDTDSPIKFILKVNGNLHDAMNHDSDFYFSTSSLDLTPWLEYVKPFSERYGFSFNGGEVSGELWGSWNKGKWESVQSIVDLQNIYLLNSQTTTDTTLINQFIANIKAEYKDNNNWSIAADNVRWIVNNLVIPEHQFSVEVSMPRDSEPHNIEIFVSYLNLRYLDIWLNNPLLPNKVRDFIVEQQPYGELSQLYLKFNDSIKSLGNLSAAAKFSSIGFRQLGRFPGFSGLSGELEVTQGKGLIKLNSRNVNLDLTPLFRQAFHLNIIRGNVGLNFSTDNVDIELNNLRLENDDAAAIGYGNLKIPYDGSKPITDLLVNFRAFNAKNIGSYYPIEIMDNKLINWLDSAIEQGRLTNGLLQLQGDLQHFPFENNENGMFLVTAQMHDANLLYEEDWPKLENINGRLVFSGRSMEIEVNNATTLGADIKKATAYIARMEKDVDMFLDITGLVDFEIDQGLAFIRRSPLIERLDENIDDIYGNGLAELSLDLQVALQKPLGAEQLPVEVSGSVTLLDNQFVLPEWQLKFDDIHGKIDFTKDSVSASKITASLYGSPINFTISSDRYANDVSTLDIDFSGTANFNSLAQRLKLPLLKVASGSTKYKGLLHAVRLSPDESYREFFVSSDMQGATIKLPGTFAKQAEEIKPLWLSVRYGKKEPRLIEFDYGNIIDSKFLYQQIVGGGYQLERGELKVNSGKAVLPQRAGVWGYIYLPEVDWQQWQPVFDLIPPLALRQSYDVDDVKWHDAIKNINVGIDRFSGFNQSINNIAIDINRTQHSWLAYINSPKLLGKIVAPDNMQAQSLDIDLQYLQLTKAAQQSSPQATMKPIKLPGVNVKIDQLDVDDIQFNHVSLVWVPTIQGVSIKTLKLTNPALDLSAQGSWIMTEQGIQTTLYGVLTINDVQTATSLWNINTSLDQTRGSINFNLGWPGTPADFDMKKLTGTAALNLSEGAFTALSGDAGSKVGLGRILTVLSVTNLAKRLQMNLKKVDQGSFVFSSLNGSFVFANGSLRTNNTKIDGLVANVDIQGAVDLREETYDLSLLIKPDVTANLPVLIALAGGPITGIAAFLANRVFSPSVSRVIATKYQLSGSWSAPVWEETAVIEEKITENEIGEENE